MPHRCKVVCKYALLRIQLRRRRLQRRLCRRLRPLAALQGELMLIPTRPTARATILPAGRCTTFFVVTAAGSAAARRGARTLAPRP